MDVYQKIIYPSLGIIIICQSFNINLLRIRDVIIYNLMTLHSYHNTCGNIWKITGQFTQVKCSASKVCQWILSNWLETCIHVHNWLNIFDNHIRQQSCLSWLSKNPRWLFHDKPGKNPDYSLNETMMWNEKMICPDSQMMRGITYNGWGIHGLYTRAIYRDYI